LLISAMAGLQSKKKKPYLSHFDQKSNLDFKERESKS
jgi:hypothetical protein